MTKIEEEIKDLKKRIDDLNHNALDSFILSLDNHFLDIPFLTSGQSAQLVSRIEESNYNIVYWDITQADCYVPSHYHTKSTEIIIIISGKLIDKINNKTYATGDVIVVPPKEKHEFFIEANTKFLVIFVPALSIELVENHGRSP